MYLMEHAVAGKMIRSEFCRIILDWGFMMSFLHLIYTI